MYVGVPGVLFPSDGFGPARLFTAILPSVSVGGDRVTIMLGALQKIIKDGHPHCSWVSLY